MKPLPTTDELLHVAQRVVWFKEPAETLRSPVHFLAFAMTYGTVEDLKILHRYVDEDTYRDVLCNAPAGIFDARSWAFWTNQCGCPNIPLPTRHVP